MNRRNINWLKRNLYEMIDPNNANAGGGSQGGGAPIEFSPYRPATWDEDGYTPGVPDNRPNWNWPGFNSPPSRYGPSRNPTHFDYPTPPNVPNGYLYWNPTLGRWELWEDLGSPYGKPAALPRYRYNPDTGQWEKLSASDIFG